MRVLTEDVNLLYTKIMAKKKSDKIEEFDGMLDKIKSLMALDQISKTVNDVDSVMSGLFGKDELTVREDASKDGINPTGVGGGIVLDMHMDTLSREYATAFGKNNKQDVMPVFSALRRYLGRRIIAFADGGDHECEMDLMTGVTKGGQTVKKDQMMKILGMMAGHVSNVKNIMDVSFPEMKEVWREMILNDKISAGKIMEICGIDPVICYSDGWNTTVLPDPLLLAANVEIVRKGYYSWYDRKKIKPEEVFFSLSSKIRKQASALFFPDLSPEDFCVKELPEDSRLTLQNFEPEIHSDLNYLFGLSLCGTISPDKETLAAQKIKSLERDFKTDEFCFLIDPSQGYFERKQMLLVAYNQMLSSKTGAQVDIKKFVRYVIDTFPSSVTGTGFQIFFPKYKGFTKTWAYGTGADGIVSGICNVLKKIPEYQWFDLSKFMECYCAMSVKGASASMQLFSFYNLSKSKLADRETGKGINVDDQWNTVTKPFIWAYLAMLCGCGVLEFAIERVSDDSPLGRAVYMRVTPLGRYALGVAVKYASADADSLSDMFELDDNNFIVLLTKGSPYKAFLDKIGESAGPYRYRISPRSIVASCSTRSEVIDKVDAFETIFHTTDNKRWTEMLDQAEKRSCCVENDLCEYSLYKLDPGVDGLLDFIAHNKEISRHVIKAEKCHLLVESAFLLQFKTILHEAGFLL